MSDSKRIIECVPNFSEGRDASVIRQITDAIESVAGVQLLHVDSGSAANRTVVTFVGAPDAVTEAAFLGAKKAAEVIDMRLHHGTHPRIGATDVLPLVPISGVPIEECTMRAVILASRMAQEAGIPCYCYEEAALRQEFRNLAVCRAGEYEALRTKLFTPSLMPDFLPPDFPSDASAPIPESVLRSGISVVGARQFLVAVNFNLNTKDVSVAKAIAADVRQKGASTRPFALQRVKAIGWYIDEYGVAQVSVNLTDINTTPLHVVFDTISRCAQTHGVTVTGTELIGLVPKQVLTEAGAFFLNRRHEDASLAVEADLVAAAVEGMRLDDLCPFDARKRVIEYLLS